MLKYPTRYEYGYSEVMHKGKNISTSLSVEMDNFINTLESSFDIENGKIPIYHKGRPDLTSHAFYASPKFWWFLLMFNSIEDPFNSFNSGDIIRIPQL
jgi:hypothetical protein